MALVVPRLLPSPHGAACPPNRAASSAQLLPCTWGARKGTGPLAAAAVGPGRGHVAPCGPTCRRAAHPAAHLVGAAGPGGRGRWDKGRLSGGEGWGLAAVGGAGVADLGAPPSETAARRFVVVMHNPLPECACAFRLVALDQSRLDLACRCISSALLLSDGVRRDTEVLCLFPPARPTGDALEQGKGWLALALKGSEVAHMRPDERNVASVIRRAIYPAACAGELHVPPLETPAHAAWCAANPAPATVPPKGQGRRHVGRGAGEGRPWRNTDASNKCARGVSLAHLPSFEALFSNDPNHMVLLGEAAVSGGVAGVSSSLQGGAGCGWTIVLGDQAGLTGAEEERILEAARAGGQGRRGERVSLGPTSLHAHQCVAIVQHHLDLLEPPAEPGGSEGSSRAGGVAAAAASAAMSSGGVAGPPRGMGWGGGATRRAEPGRLRAVAPGAEGRWAPADGVAMHPRRLDKFLLDAGVGTRDACKALIREGRAAINGEAAPQHRLVDPPRDHVEVDGNEVWLRAPQLYAAFHKPVGAITAMSDPYGRPHIGALVPGTWHESGISHVGRLDANTTGLLLFTDDGDLAHLVSRGGGGVWKRYQATVAGALARDDPRVAALAGTMDLGGGDVVRGARVRVIPGGRGDTTEVEVEVNEGRNQQVRRMIGAAHLTLHALHRSAVGPVSLGDVPEGGWRALSAREVESLYDAAGGRGQVAAAVAEALAARLARGTLEGRDAALVRAFLGGSE